MGREFEVSDTSGSLQDSEEGQKSRENYVGMGKEKSLVQDLVSVSPTDPFSSRGSHPCFQGSS